MKTHITTIKFQLKDKQIELTADEARVLLDEFMTLFAMGIKEQNAWNGPIVIDRETSGYPWPSHWAVTRSYVHGTETSALLVAEEA